MATIVDAAQVEVTFSQAGQLVQNVFHVLAAHPLSQVEADAIHGTVDTWIKNTLRPLQATNVLYMGMTVKDIYTGFARFDYPGDGLAGTRPGLTLPNELTFCLKKATALSGRAFRGRFYHIGLSDNAYDSTDRNKITSAASTALVTCYAALMTALSTASHPLQVVQWDHTVRPPVPKTQVPVTAIVATDLILDSQRRRKPGVGR